MASIKASAKKIIDWAFFLGSSTPLPKKLVSETLTRHEELSRLIFEAKESIPTIHWAYYQNHLRPSDMSWIENCKKSVDSFKPQALPSTKDTLKAIETEEQKLNEEADGFIKKNQEESRFAKSKYDLLMAMPSVDNMTMDDVYKVYPEWREEFEERLRRDFWCHNYSLTDYEAAVKTWKDHHHAH